jgi:polyphosphate kinase
MIPATLPRFIRIPGEATRYVAIATLIVGRIGTVFPGYEVLGGGAFRIIRDSDIEIEEEAEDLVRYFRSAIKRRRRGRVIRLKLETGMPPELEALVREGLDASEAIVSVSTGFLGIGDLQLLVDEDRPDLKFPPYSPRFPERIREHGGDCFARSEPRTSSSTTLMRASRW